MKRIFGSVSLIVLLASCISAPRPHSVAGKLNRGWQTGFMSGYKACLSNGLMAVPAQRDVVAVDIDSGNVAWKYESPKEKLWNCTSCQPFNDRFLACFDSGAGSLVVEIDANGNELKKHFTERLSSQPAVAGYKFWQVQSNIAYGNAGQFKIEPSLPSVAANTDLVFLITTNNIVRAYNSYGKIIWYVGFKAIASDIHLVGDRLFVRTDKGLVCLNAGNGDILWQLECMVSVFPKAFDANYIFATDKSILEIDSSGAIQKSIQLENILSLEIAQDGFVVVANSKLITFDKVFGKIDEIGVSDGVHQALPAQGGIVTNGTLGQAIYKLDRP